MCSFRFSICCLWKIRWVFSKNLNIWDIAAGIIIVKEAGGEINDIDIFNQKINKIVASSNHISLKFKEKLVNF